MIELTSRPRLAARARLHYDRHEDRHMLLYPEKGLKLNASALTILQLCDGQRSVAEIAQQLAQGLQHTALERVEHDVLSFLQTLESRALIQAEP